MRTPLLLLLHVAGLEVVNGWTTIVDLTLVKKNPTRATTTRTTTKSLFADTTASVQDDYDDWFDDYDPSDYKDIPTTTNDKRRNTLSDVGGGRRRHHHDYTRDVTVDSSNVDVAAIDGLIAQRLGYRKTGRFDEADDIRDELLKKHGVAIFDREKVWRSGCSTGGSGMKWRPSQSSSSSNNSNHRRASPPLHRKRRNFGPNGHDYHLARDAGPNTSSLDETEIHALLAERLECKMSRDFQNADAIQDELIQAGVFVNDGSKEWRADGKQGFGRRDHFRGGNSRNQSRNQPYQQSAHSLPVDDAADIIIQDLVDERMDAKRVRDYRVADEIRDELQTEFNVEINDRLRQWSVGGDFGISQQQQQQQDNNYVKSSDSTTPENADEIQRLVEERDEARKVRDFDTADAIREELLKQDIMIDDKLCQWAVVDGRFSGGNNNNNNNNNNNRRDASSPRSPFVKLGAGGDLTNEEEALIAKLLGERSEAQRDRQFGKADRIRDRLERDFKVRIDDRAREWHVVSDKYVMMMPPDETDMDADVCKLIEERIVERSVAKLQKDYDTADAIRLELAQTYNVDIDDRLREWRVLSVPPPLPSDADDSVFDADDSVFDVDESDFEGDEDDDVDTEVESVDDADETMESEDLTSLTVPELKVRLREAGLPVSGRKAELIERLTSSYS